MSETKGDYYPRNGVVKGPEVIAKTRIAQMPGVRVSTILFVSGLYETLALGLADEHPLCCNQWQTRDEGEALANHARMSLMLADEAAKLHA